MPVLPPTLVRCLPFLAWPRPSLALLRGELAAGITVGLMLVPQGVAYAALAGMPLVAGIYASLLPALVAVLWSSSTRLGVGPTALTSLLLGASLAGLATPGSAQWVQLVLWLTLLSGAVQMLLGLARMGWLLQLVTSPVLTGFTLAAALLILATQLPALLGLQVAAGAWPTLAQLPPWPEVPGWLAHWLAQHLDGWACALGLGSLVLLQAARRLRPSFPAALLVLALAGLVSWASGFAARGGAVVGSLPAGLPTLVLPEWPGWPLWSQLLLPALVITLVSFLETASSAKVEHQQGGTRWDENQDLLAHGMAKISAAFTGGFATSASFSRSAINLYAGAKTGWATIFALLLVLGVLLWLTPLLYHVPQSALAALVVVAVASLVKPGALLRLWRMARAEAVISATTLVLTLVSAPRLYVGVLVGLAMNVALFLYHRLHPRIIEVGLHADGSLRDRVLWQLPMLAPGLLALRMDAELDFASASSLERHIGEQLQRRPELHAVCLFAQPINRIDVTGVETFVRLRTLLHQHGGVLHVSGLKLPVQQTLERAGALYPGNDLVLYRADAPALAALCGTTPPEPQEPN